eukprot:15440467-Alexandrium_andersonii.AAC.1
MTPQRSLGGSPVARSQERESWLAAAVRAYFGARGLPVDLDRPPVSVAEKLQPLAFSRCGVHSLAP